jgi:FkbM family methyltransferase
MLALLPSWVQVPIVGGPLRGWRWFVGADGVGIGLGLKDTNKHPIFGAILKEGDVVFDVGARFGFYSLLAARLAGGLGQVFAFEPLPPRHGYIDGHLAINHVHNVTLIRSAVGRRSSELSVGLSAAGNSTQRSPDVRVDTVSLDDLWNSGVVPAPHIIKIDVDGRELDILRGAERLLVACRPVLWISTSEGESTKTDRFLSELGYQVEVLDGSEMIGRSGQAGGRGRP